MTPKIEQVAVADLIPYASNSRTHSDAQVAQIAASIKEFGWTNPILIDGEKGLIAGHGRLLAARKLGLENVPAIILDHLTKAQQRALVIADNQLALNAGWDINMLKAEIEDLKLEDFDLSLLGFDDEFLDGLLEPEPTEGLTDEDAVPDVPLVPKTVLGDVWVLGNHRLMCGDSTSIDALQTLTGGGAG
jgi:ParB-like chromosome segregation protein Spo0J